MNLVLIDVLEKDLIAKHGTQILLQKPKRDTKSCDLFQTPGNHDPDDSTKDLILASY